MVMTDELGCCHRATSRLYRSESIASGSYAEMGPCGSRQPPSKLLLESGRRRAFKGRQPLTRNVVADMAYELARRLRYFIRPASDPPARPRLQPLSWRLLQADRQRIAHVAQWAGWSTGQGRWCA